VILKCAKDDDICTLKAADEADLLSLTHLYADRISDYELKLMDIDTDTLGIPDTEYDVCVSMPSADFARIVRDLSALGESVKIDVSKDGIRFSAEGEAANGNILVKQSENARRRFKKVGKEKEKEKKSKVKKEAGGEDEEEEEPESEDEEGESSKKKKKTKVKKEEGGSDVEMVDDDDEEEEEAKPDEDGDEDEDSDVGKKKRKKAPSKPVKPAKRAKKTDDDDEDEDVGLVSIDMNQAVTLTFSLKYLVNFSKSTSLSRQVQLMMSADVPLLVAYEFTQGKIHYYLAPKIGDD